MLKSPIFFAAIACLGFGFSGPASKVALRENSDANAVIFWCGLGILLASMVSAILQGRVPVFGNFKGVSYGALNGVFVGIAYVALFMAFSLLPKGSELFAAVLAITAIYPLVTVVVELGFMKIPQGISWKLVIPGIFLALSGAIMVSLGMPK